MTATTQSPLVSVDWLKANQNKPDFHIIEISGMMNGTYENYKSGHIPGAIFWDWKDKLWDEFKRDYASPETLAARFSATGITNESTVVFYSRDTQFGVYGWWVTKYCGFENGYILDGGEKAWELAGNTLEQGENLPDTTASYQPVFHRHENMRVRRDTVLDSLGRADTIIIDGRTPEEYSGTTVSPINNGGAIRSGRIPGAVSIPYFTLLDENKCFLSKDKIQAIFDKYQINNYKNIFVYCRLGHRASLMYFVLHNLLGYTNVKSYDGSWIEWGNIVGFPIEK